MDKIEIIMKTAKMLADENRGEWSGDVHEFATASAYITPDERLWLTSHEVKHFPQRTQGWGICERICLCFSLLCEWRTFAYSPRCRQREGVAWTSDTK
jgi:hypothetical protein